MKFTVNYDIWFCFRKITAKLVVNVGSECWKSRFRGSRFQNFTGENTPGPPLIVAPKARMASAMPTTSHISNDLAPPPPPTSTTFLRHWPGTKASSTSGVSRGGGGGEGGSCRERHFLGGGTFGDRCRVFPIHCFNKNK